MSYIVRGTPLFARAGGLIHLPRPQVGGGEGRSAKAQVQIRPGPFGPPDPPGGGVWSPTGGGSKNGNWAPENLNDKKPFFQKHPILYRRRSSEARAKARGCKSYRRRGVQAKPKTCDGPEYGSYGP